MNNLCENHGPFYKALKAGFPFGELISVPGVSVIHVVAFASMDLE